MDKVRPLSKKEKADLAALPFSESVYRKQAKIIQGVSLVGGKSTVYEKMWRLPSVSVNAFEASSRKQAANIINDVAWARVGIRTVQDMDAQETLGLLKDHLERVAPWGVHVRIEPETPARWWKTDVDHPVFQAALKALEKGYGAKPVVAGAGGSIPFVDTISRAFGGAPALLFGVGDPYSAAHSENESLLLADWEKGCKSVIHLLAELVGLSN
jgi:acetylornithine deacetylase/succinyl-diaminopimelate desuccinylase-like protein